MLLKILDPKFVSSCNHCIKINIFNWIFSFLYSPSIHINIELSMACRALLFKARNVVSTRALYMQIQVISICPFQSEVILFSNFSTSLTNVLNNFSDFDFFVKMDKGLTSIISFSNFSQIKNYIFEIFLSSISKDLSILTRN